MLVLTLWFRKASDVAFLTVRDRIADVMSDLQENLGGIRIVTATNRAKRNVVGHDNVLGSYRDANDQTAVIGAVYGPSTELLGYLAQALLLGLGGWLVSRGQPHRRRAGRVLPLPDDVLRPDPAAGAAVQHVPAGPGRGPQARRPVRHRARRARGAGRARPAADGGRHRARPRDLRLRPGRPGARRRRPCSIAAGETVAFVGETGAGKSTVAKLVNRYYDPTEGTVRIDGHDLRDVTLASVRRQIGVVPQEPFLFAGSIRDNLDVRRTRRHRRRAVGRRRRRRTPRPGRPAAGRPRPDHPRARLVAQLGRASAPGPGPGVPVPAPRPGARRGHVEPRPRQRDPHRDRARRRARGPDGDHHRPPAGHGDAGRSHRRRPRRRDRRARAATPNSSPSAAGTPRSTRPGRRRPAARGRRPPRDRSRRERLAAGGRLRRSRRSGRSSRARSDSATT